MNDNFLTACTGQRTSKRQPMFTMQTMLSDAYTMMNETKTELEDLTTRRTANERKLDLMIKKIDSVVSDIMPVFAEAKELLADMKMEQKMSENVLEKLGGKSCQICYRTDSVHGGDWHICSPCGHGRFHKDCLEKWLSEKKCCPACRREVKSSQPFFEL